MKKKKKKKIIRFDHLFNCRTIYDAIFVSSFPLFLYVSTKYKEKLSNIMKIWIRFQCCFVNTWIKFQFSRKYTLSYIVCLRRPKNVFRKCKNQCKRYAFKTQHLYQYFTVPWIQMNGLTVISWIWPPNAKTAHARFFIYIYLYTCMRETSIRAAERAESKSLFVPSK